MTTKTPVWVHGGACGALRCRENCPHYLPGPKINGWLTCLCGHTQAVHAKIKMEERL